MKTSLPIIIIAYLLFAVAFTVGAQTPGENYIYTYDVMEPVINSADLNHNTADHIALKTIQYFDGLGRPSQTVQKGFSYTNKDVIKPFEYNQFGVDTINYLPYVGKYSDGSFKTDFHSSQAEFYSERYNGDANGYSPTMLEKSPLQRILKQGAPGESWQIGHGGHPVSFQYFTNDNSAPLEAKSWAIDEEGKCKYTGYYPNGELYVVKTSDEDSSANYEFMDKQGRVVLKRAELSSTSYADTYYIYDDFGLLRYVLSPEGSERISGDISMDDDVVKQYVYCYIYDSRKRLIEKRIPGKEEEYFIYNKADQLILYQDGNMRRFITGKPNFEWAFTKYDGLGRVVITGITYQFLTETRTTIQDIVNQKNVCFETTQHAAIYPVANNNYYTNNAFPKINPNDKLYTISYYDSYVISTSQGIKPIVSETNMEFNPAEASFNLPDAELRYTSGMKTISFIEYNNYLYPSVYYYDTRGRLIQEKTINQRKRMDVNCQVYVGLTDKASASEHKHCTAIGTRNYNLTEKYTFEYDDEKRLLQRDYYFNNQHKQKIVFTYSAMGDHVIKKQYYEGTTLCQSLDYQYNIRGWLTRINDPDNFASSGDYFCMQLLYDQKFNTQVNGTPRYNGNISFIRWQSKAPLGAINTEWLGEKGYAFSYDKLNRLSGTSFYEYVSGRLDNTDAYQEYIPGYDKNGNIKFLKRNGKSAGSTVNIDNLSYYYKGNQVIGIDDVIAKSYGYDFNDNGHYYFATDTIEYKYDSNGNLICDLNKGIISITYNELNLPKTIDFDGNNRIQYDYDALGNKRSQTTIEAGRKVKTIEFIGNFVYENDYPAYNTFDEGRIVYKPDSTFFVETYLKDHLGNVRVAYANDGVKDGIRQINSYYPFGLNINALSANSTSLLQRNEYLYNSKMFQDEMGLNWLDFGARFYDGVVGRWWRVDPLAEERQWLSPYNYCSLNPISRIDPDGMLDDWVERDNQVVWDENVTSATDADLKSRDKYLGNEGYGVNTETGASIHYKSDGTTSEGSFGIVGVTITGIMSDHVRTMSNPVVQAIHQGQEDFLNHPVTKATVNTLLFVAAGGIEGVTALGGAAVRSIGNVKVPIYRAFGGEARAIGNYWSLINPKLYGSQYRNLAGLPNSNTGAFTLKATTPLRNIKPSTIKPAAPLDGNFGRLVPELKVFDKGSVVVKDFWVNF